jgi:hypothetical protein
LVRFKPLICKGGSVSVHLSSVLSRMLRDPQVLTAE